jgi:tetratricopeptide (TPR) repeat protein
MKPQPLSGFLQLIALSCLISCAGKNEKQTLVAGTELELKRGRLISCGPPSKEFGFVDFDFSCSKETRDDFNLGVKLLHSFEYDEAEKVFAGIIDKQPDCGMAYWGVAMANFHALWTPPTEAELKKGAKAVELARAAKPLSEKENLYLDAISAFYRDWQTLDHMTRTVAFETAMKKLYDSYPDDKETAVFYSLALVAAADPADKTYSRQKTAGAILKELYAKYPNHPGVVHYMIHTYDSPEMAALGLEAAKRYAAVAPSSAHALHMPSHIFTRLGLWEESIASNLASVASAKCYAESAGIKGHWDEEVHGLDYLVYAYLQNGQSDSAKAEWDYLKTIHSIWPENFKVAYSFASIPARYVLENKLWEEAAALQPHDRDLDWEKYPWQYSIILFTRLLGAVHTGKMEDAKKELNALKQMQEKLTQGKDAYKANQVAIQVKSGEAWIKFREGPKETALKLMAEAADMEDKTGKHPVTPGEVLPQRELLADMLMESGKPQAALKEYEADLEKHPNRFSSVYGAAVAAKKSGDLLNAGKYYELLVKNSSPDGNRAGLIEARTFLKQ